jgi:hypothetical protein
LGCFAIGGRCPSWWSLSSCSWGMGAAARRPRSPAAVGRPAVILAAMSARRAVTANRAFPKEHSAAASGMEACVRMATPAVQGAVAPVLAAAVAAVAAGEEVPEVAEAATAPRTSTPQLVPMGPRNAVRSTWSVATTARTTARSAASFKASASDGGSSWSGEPTKPSSILACHPSPGPVTVRISRST